MLVYTSEALSAPLDVIGPVSVVRYAASEALDTDFTAKIVDVLPDATHAGSGGALRDQAQAPGTHLSSGTPDPDRGVLERLPFINPNQNTGNPVATDVAWRVAHQTVYHDGEHPSALILPVVPRPTVP